MTRNRVTVASLTTTLLIFSCFLALAMGGWQVEKQMGGRTRTRIDQTSNTIICYRDEHAQIQCMQHYGRTLAQHFLVDDPRKESCTLRYSVEQYSKTTFTLSLLLHHADRSYRAFKPSLNSTAELKLDFRFISSVSDH